MLGQDVRRLSVGPVKNGDRLGRVGLGEGERHGVRTRRRHRGERTGPDAIDVERRVGLQVVERERHVSSRERLCRRST